MKKLFLAGVTAVAFAAGSSSYAADLPAYKAPPPIVPACANFGGFYVGAHGSWVTHDWTFKDRDGLSELLNGNRSFGISDDGSQNGWGAGVQAGWNYQARCAVFGIEADWSWTRTSDNKFWTDGQLGNNLDTINIDNNMKWFGTIRTRSGVVVDNLLLYVTAGFAWAKFDRTYTFVDRRGGNITTDIFDDEGNNRWGGVVGVGAEWALWSSVSLKGEVLYARFKDTESSFASQIATVRGENPTRRFENQDSVWVSRIGLNWRFGGGPIIARY